jgi:hypothetical protein
MLQSFLFIQADYKALFNGIQFDLSPLSLNVPAIVFPLEVMKK